MNKKIAFRSLLASIVAFSAATISLLAVTISSFLGPNIDTSDDNYLDGDVGLRNYFFSGDGSEENPYEIVSPIHFYNLSRLQNLGIFAGKTYFQIGHVFDIEGEPALKCIDHYDSEGEPVYTDYLDMGTFSTSNRVMTIGGEGVPFVGNFNGNGLPIKNLTMYGNPDDIGMFGYVAHQGKLENILLDNVEIVSLGYNNTSGDPDNDLFSEDIDDIFHSSSYLATDTSLALYDYNAVNDEYTQKNLKKLTRNVFIL